MTDDELIARSKKLLANDFGDEGDLCIDLAVALGVAADRIAVLAEGFRVADEALCHAIRTGFYCGEGILETLAKTRATPTTATKIEKDGAR